MRRPVCKALLASVLALLAVPGRATGETDALYRERCASCHGADRMGGTGPALFPENLGRLSRAAAETVIASGRTATQMPGFAEQLSPAKIKALASYVFAPPAVTPVWGEAEIRASRTMGEPPAAGATPAYDADPLNLFVVVETGDHHVTILDGDRFKPIHRFASRFALHGGPKFSPDGRFVYFASRDGWVTMFDLYTLETVAEARAGLNARNLAISADGRYVAVANSLPRTLVILDARDLSLLRLFEVRDRRGGASSRVSAVYQAPTRNSFIAAMKDIPEIWEISTDPAAPPVRTGLVHSYEKGLEEALPAPSGLFALRRIEIEEPLDDFFFDPPYRNLFGSAREGKGAVVVNLNVGRVVARLDVTGLPHLGSGITWRRQGRAVMATPNLKEAKITVVDLEDWSVVGEIATDGPGFFLRSHENTPYLWADVFLGPKRDSIHVIDKQSLEIVRTLRPAPGKTVGHVEFTRDGRHALLSVWEMDGALIVYDAATLEEVTRIPMRKPSGKYNVFNKITFSSGTSH